MSELRKFNADFIGTYLSHKGRDRSPEVILERLNGCRQAHGLRPTNLKVVGAIVLRILRALDEAPPAPPRAKGWTAEHVALLREMRDKESDGVIARQLGKSRNAVVGMRHRLAALASWSSAEEATATNLYEHGVHAREIANTLNQLYRKGRSPESVRHRMNLLGVIWGCRSADSEVRAQCAVFAKSARVRAEAIAAAERAPYHPLKDNARLLALLNHTGPTMEGRSCAS